MRLVYGNYEFPVGGVKVAQSQSTVVDAARRPILFRKKCLCDGYLELPAGTAANQQQNVLSELQRDLENALERPYRDLILLQDGVGDSATALYQLSSISGVVITDGPNFPDAVGSEYSTTRHFTFTAEADYDWDDRGILVGDIFSWRETLTFSGGKPIYRMRLAVNGPPQRQKVYAQTPFMATQQGEAIGYFQTPDPPDPIWPEWLKEAGDIGESSPDATGNPLQGQRMYRRTWKYSFESIVSLVGKPNRWP